MSVSLQLDSVDIRATERENGEARGSFFRHDPTIAQPAGVQPQFKSSRRARLTVTNEDLEKFRQQRRQNEEAYDREYKALGMPSREELKLNERERELRLREIAAMVELERSRADALQAQIDALAARQQAMASYSPPVPYGYDNYGYGGFGNAGYWPLATTVTAIDGGFPFDPLFSDQSFFGFQNGFGRFRRHSGFYDSSFRRRIYVAPRAPFFEVRGAPRTIRPHR
jgi:hypothetical protein